MDNLNLVAQKIFDRAIYSTNIREILSESGYGDLVIENNIVGIIEDVLREEAAFGNLGEEPPPQRYSEKS